MTKPLIELIVTQFFGARPEYYGPGGHPGVDFRTKFNNASNSFWNNFIGWQPVYAVENGICIVTYDKKGYGTHLWLANTPSGNRYLYAHLKNARPPTPNSVIPAGPILKFFAKEGEIIGITDNTGNSTGSHLHFGYKPVGSDKFADPIQLFQNLIQPKEWPVLYVGQNQPDMSSFEANVSRFTNNLLSIRPRSILSQIQVSTGMPTYDQSRSFLNSIDTNGIKSVFIFYPANSTSAYFSASYYPEKNISFVTCPLPGDTDVYTHEFLHLFRKWVNSNGLGFIEDVEYYAPNWRFEEQYAQLVPIIAKL